MARYIFSAFLAFALGGVEVASFAPNSLGTSHRTNALGMSEGGSDDGEVVANKYSR